MYSVGSVRLLSVTVANRTTDKTFGSKNADPNVDKTCKCPGVTGEFAATGPTSGSSTGASVGHSFDKLAMSVTNTVVVTASSFKTTDASTEGSTLACDVVEK